MTNRSVQRNTLNIITGTIIISCLTVKETDLIASCNDNLDRKIAYISALDDREYPA